MLRRDPYEPTKERIDQTLSCSTEVHDIQRRCDDKHQVHCGENHRVSKLCVGKHESQIDEPGKLRVPQSRPNRCKARRFLS